MVKRTIPDVILYPADIVNIIVQACKSRCNIVQWVHLRPSTMMIWYPKLVLTKGDITGLSTDDGCNANAASWNGP